MGARRAWVLAAAMGLLTGTGELLWTLPSGLEAPVADGRLGAPDGWPVVGWPVEVPRVPAAALEAAAKLKAGEVPAATDAFEVHAEPGRPPLIYVVKGVEGDVAVVYSTLGGWSLVSTALLAQEIGRAP